VILLLSSLFFTTPAPLDMPRAEGWLVTEGGREHFEDRYSVGDLWHNRTVTGYWLEDDGVRGFLLADLEYLPPSVPAVTTRAEYERTLVRADKRDDRQLLCQLQQLASVYPLAVSEKYARPHQLPRGMKAVRYYEGTNLQHIVCAYLPEKGDHWSVVVWELAEGDDREEMRRTFEENYWEELKEADRRREAPAETDKAASGARRRRRSAALSERGLLKRDAAHSVAAYANWHCTSGEDFIVLDDLRDARLFVTSLTNDLAKCRGRFAAVMPTVVDTTNVLSVARLYRRRADFLIAAGEDMQWTAAYWNSRRRELVACLPENGGFEQLRRTFRHESFHQYLSYATAMIPVSPWLNEGYAEYFEEEGAELHELTLTDEQWDEAELALPALLALDYTGFYAGTDVQRRSRYKLAWSVAFFIEHGLRDIPHDPFRTLKADYFRNLSRTRDMQQATAACFGSRERLEQFANEWKKFWKNRH